MKKSYIIDISFENTRLDRWFKKYISNVPQSLIEKSIRKGNIKVNKKSKKGSYLLKINDQIDLFNLKLSLNKKKTLAYKPSKKELSLTSSFIIENNENFVVINKPAGIAVQSGTKSRKNIIDILKDTNEFSECKPFTVHRIDKETTGILIVAKNRKYAQLFTSLFRIRKIHKIYLAIVVGEVKNKKGTLEDVLFHYENDKKISTKAITNYEVIDTNNNYSLLKLNPQTGRKHQLRKQLLIFGHPILGDSKYRISESKFTKKSSLLLHAHKINFTVNNTKYKFVARPSDEFNNTLNEKYLKNFY